MSHPSERPVTQATQPPAAWRAFGLVEDLEIDFAGSDRPLLVTEVLRRCAEPATADDGPIWNMTLAARIGGLIAVLAATARADSLPLTVRCPHGDCRKEMEVELPFSPLLEMAAAARPDDRVGYRGLTLRRPRGVDQRRWRAQGFGNRAEAEAAVLATLCVGGAVDQADRAGLTEALAAFDPLAAFELAVTCPECARAADIPIDLERLLLGELARAQSTMMDEVDRLARRYGWSEAEVLAIPRWRRLKYLALEEDRWP